MNKLMRLYYAIKHTTWNPLDWARQYNDQLICLDFKTAWAIAGIILDCHALFKGRRP